MDLYSVMCVSDRIKALEWFEAFFGRPADEIIGEEYLWRLGENAWVVVDDRDVRAERVGGAMITLGVNDLDDILARLAAHGIDHEPVETYSNGVRHVTVLDPDGNSLSLAEAPTRRAFSNPCGELGHTAPGLLKMRLGNARHQEEPANPTRDATSIIDAPLTAVRTGPVDSCSGSEDFSAITHIIRAMWRSLSLIRFIRPPVEPTAGRWTYSKMSIRSSRSLDWRTRS